MSIRDQDQGRNPLQVSANIRIIEKTKKISMERMEKIFESWNQTIDEGNAKEILQQMDQIIGIVKKEGFLRNEVYEKFANEMAKFIQEKFTSKMITQNKEKIIEVINAISLITPSLSNLPKIMSEKIPELISSTLQRATSALSSLGDLAASPTSVASVARDAAKTLIHQFVPGNGDARQDVMSGIGMAVKKLTGIDSLETLARKFKLDDDPLVKGVIDFVKKPDKANVMDLMFNAIDAAAPAGTVGKIAKKIAEVTMSPTQIQYRLTEAAFSNAGAGDAANSNKELQMALLAAKKSGEDIQVDGGTAHQILAICQAAVRTGTKITVNSVLPEVQKAIQDNMEKFKDLIILAPKDIAQDQGVKPPRPTT